MSRLCANRSFFVYLPHTQRVLYQLLLSHRDCRGFSILEEGTDAYISPGELDAHRQNMRPKLCLISLANYLGRATHYGRHFRAGYERCYGVTSQAFRHYRRRVIIDPLDVPSGFECGESREYDNSILVIPDRSVEDQLTSLEAYSEGIRGAVDHMRSCGVVGSRPVYVKFHPDQDPIVTQRIRDALDSVIGSDGYGVLDDSHIIECILWNSKDMAIVTSFSSSGFYAHQSGHKVYSFARRVAKSDKAYESSLFFLFADYAQVVEQI